MSEDLQLILAELESIKRMLGDRVPRSMEDLTRPLTAEELCERWKVVASSDALRLDYLTRKCRAWGLRPLSGGRGWHARYSREAVLHAESYASGKINRRRNKR